MHYPLIASAGFEFWLQLSTSSRTASRDHMEIAHRHHTSIDWRLALLATYWCLTRSPNHTISGLNRRRRSDRARGFQIGRNPLSQLSQ